MKDRRNRRYAAALGAASIALAGMTFKAADAQTPAENPAAPAGPVAPSAPAPPAAAATPPPNYGVQYNGLLDGYYEFQFNNPKFHGTPNDLGGLRVYDVRENAPTLALAELNVLKNPRPASFGFKATFIAGDTADINHLNFPPGGTHDGKGESRYKNVQQLYGTYAFSGAGGGIDFGKFYTPFGYEVTESNGNYNYSRSLPYNLLPFYHAGLRAYTPSLKGFVITGYVVNSIFNTPTSGVQNDSNHASYIGQLNFTDPKGKYTAITTDGFGKQKLPGGPGSIGNKIFLSDNDFTWNFNAKMLAGLNYVYGRESPDGGGRTRSNGYAVYWRNQVTAKTAYAVRFSGFDSKTETPGAPTTTARPYEGTLTYEIKPVANILTRIEYRHDHSNVPLFLARDSTPSKKSQDTLTLSGVYTF